tara:strand:- start:2610 stop:3995 length:1386 start_codon:yes stop_codon:yes gene_type:complete
MTNSSVFSEPPQVVINSLIDYKKLEQQEYIDIWNREESREKCLGEQIYNEFLQTAKPRAGSSVLDIGCGTGRGGLNLAVFGKLNVTYVDFAPNCLDKDIVPMLETQKHTLRFMEGNITEPIKDNAAYGYCVDVIEHLTPDDIDKALDNCLKACQHVFFCMSTKIYKYEWWLEKFNSRDCVVHWSDNSGDYCKVYATAWADGTDIVDIGVVNTDDEIVKNNVLHNISLGIQQVKPYPTNDIEAMIVGGGPSVESNIEKIRQLRESGVKLITINGAYKWCIDKGLSPSALIIVDARPFNVKFTKPIIEDCKYFIASQCDPALFEGLPKERTYIWHTGAELIGAILREKYKHWWHTPGGSTALLRAIPLFRMLGFKRFHLFGCDSCLDEEKHHAYEQKENDGDAVVPVNVGGKIFYCNPWMVSQAQEFITLIEHLGDEIELEIYGGLLRHILEIGATHANIKEI